MVHNFYQSSAPSGEDAAFRNEVGLLRENGVEVIMYKKHNDEAEKRNKVKLGFDITWSHETYTEVNRVIKKEAPDLAHFHNIWYLISPSAYYACQKQSVPVIQTLHNFRMFCANGLLLYRNNICNSCIQGVRFRSILKRCYRDSLFHSAPVVTAQKIHQIKETWHNEVDGYIALTNFAKNIFCEYRIPKEKIFLKPNLARNIKCDYSNGGNMATYVGRLSTEKGIEVLCKAFNTLFKKNKNYILNVVGDGPLMSNIVLNNNGSTKCWGQQNKDSVLKILDKSAFTIIPSICYEMFPMVIAESYASGKPVIASRIGALPEIIEDHKTGLLFDPGNEDDLAEKMRWMFEHKEECIQMGKNARKVYEEKYTPEKNFKMLMDIYQTVIQEHKVKNKRRISPFLEKSRKDKIPMQRIVNPVVLHRTKFLPRSLNAALSHIVSYIDGNSGGYYCFSNIHVVIESQNNTSLNNALTNAIGIFPDGMGVALALKIIGSRFQDRVRGIDLMLKLCEYAAHENKSIFLYGNTDTVLAKLRAILKLKYPNLNIVGTMSPPFRELDSAEDQHIVQTINNSNADFLFVSLGAPKQEIWMAEHKGRIKALQFGVGAAFNFLAGDVKEAPKWMQALALEWLCRLPQQPQKTIKRMILVPQMWWLLGKQLLLERILRVRNYQKD